MKLQITGKSTRVVEVTPEQYAAHPKSIEWFVDGRDVEWQSIGGAWALSTTPCFIVDKLYRPLVKKTVPGEVWHCKDVEYGMIITSRYDFVSLKDGYNHGDTFDGAEYSAPSVDAYIARKLLEIDPITSTEPTISEEIADKVRAAARMDEA